MKEKSERRNCVKCGRNLKDNQKLRCESCMSLVNLELEGKIDKPFEYYFKYHLKRCRKENREMSQ